MNIAFSKNKLKKVMELTAATNNSTKNLETTVEETNERQMDI